jgi:hypothetical protein
MKKASMTVLISLSLLAGAAYAQEDQGIRSSTDPNVAAQVEQHAQDLQAQQQQQDERQQEMMKHKPSSHKHHPMKKATPPDQGQ